MSGAPEITVRETEPGDRDQILELLQSALGPGSTPRTPEFWEWKHRANPFGASPGWVALAGERIVGLRTFLRWRWRHADRLVESVRAVDTATHPDWQRRGIFWRLTRESLDRLAEDGCEFVFNTPNRRSGAGYRKLGWRPALKPALFVRALKPLRMAGAVIRGDRARPPADLSTLPPVTELLEWSRLDLLLSEYDRGWNARLHTPRDRAYLSWRYADIPGLEYRSLWTADGDDLTAILFRTRMRRSMREVLISEVLSHGERPARERQLETLLERLRAESDADYLVAASPEGSAEASVLRGAGFRRAPSGPSLMIRPLSGSRLGDAELASDWWQLSIGDLEIF